MNHEENVSKYYDKDYFNWQNQDGSFGGWVNKNFFQKNINLNDTVIDFGCGGGFLLKNLSCKRRIGIEPNLSAKKSIEKNGVEHFSSPQEMLDTLGSEIADVIISTNVLEHTLNPLIELQNLRKILKKNGVIHFIVPCDSINYKYNPNDINYHLYSWSPQNIGNLFSEAGFTVEYSKALIHKWPPFYKKISLLGWPLFNILSLIWGRLERSWFQVEIKAIKKNI